MNIKRIKEIREDNDKYQKEIAKYLNISQVVYSRYETGIREIPISLVDKLANYYSTSIDYLLCRTDERKPYPKSIMEQR